MIRLNVALGSLVVTIGLWLLWEDIDLPLLAAAALGLAFLLAWRSTSITEVWGWTTLLLGVESVAFPVVAMVQLRLATVEPSNEQMGRILTAILFGVFSSIFWLTFSYGIFKRLGRNKEESRR
jgi:hypothetical protein